MENKALSRFERRAVTVLTRLLWRALPRGRQRSVPVWLPFEDVLLRPPDGARIQGRWFPARDAKGTVVLAHPHRRYGQDWFWLTSWLDVLHDAGYNALTFDFVGYGTSEGGEAYFHEHLLAAVGFARSRTPKLPLHLVGLSLGAFVAINAAREIPDLASLVLESPYPSFGSWYDGSLRAWPLRFLRRAFPRTATRIDAERNIAHVHASRIVIAASRADELTPIALTRRVAAAAPPHDYLEVPDLQHLELFDASPEYRSLVLRVLSEASPPQARGAPRVAMPQGAPNAPWLA